MSLDPPQISTACVRLTLSEAEFETSDYFEQIEKETFVIMHFHCSNVALQFVHRPK